MDLNELRAFRDILLKCYDWEVREHNPYYLWLEDKKSKLYPVERMSFQEFIKEHLERLGLL